MVSPMPYRVEQAVAGGWIVVESVKTPAPLAIKLHPGELDVISLARERGVPAVLMDDSKARVAAELAGLEPRGTLWVFLQALRQGSP